MASSPVNGGYLLLVLGEPTNEAQKKTMISQLLKGLGSWPQEQCDIVLLDELKAVLDANLQGERFKNGEWLVQHSSDGLVIEILVNPQVFTLHQCLYNMLISCTSHKHVVFAGNILSGTESWLLQDGTFSMNDLVDAMNDINVHSICHAYGPGLTMHLHVPTASRWSTERLSGAALAANQNISVNPLPVQDLDSKVLREFGEYVASMLIPVALDQLMPASDIVGTIRFRRPSLYVFPAGQGDAALFGINGFSVLLDTGFGRRCCCWSFIRHLERLDAVLLTRSSAGNRLSISSIVDRKRSGAVYPKIGHVLANFVQSRRPNTDSDVDSLTLNEMVQHDTLLDNLQQMSLKPKICLASSSVEPINLYHKVGQGRLDLYVLNPQRNSLELQLYIKNQLNRVGNGNVTMKIKGKEFPIVNLVSLCCLICWIPEDKEDKVTRILLPGSTPQHKIIEGLNRLRHLDILKTPACTVRMLQRRNREKTVEHILRRTGRGSSVPSRDEIGRNEIDGTTRTRSSSRQSREFKPRLKDQAGSTVVRDTSANKAHSSNDSVKQGSSGTETRTNRKTVVRQKQSSDHRAERTSRERISRDQISFSVKLQNNTSDKPQSKKIYKIANKQSMEGKQSQINKPKEHEAEHTKKTVPLKQLNSERKKENIKNASSGNVKNEPVLSHQVENDSELEEKELNLPKNYSSEQEIGDIGRDWDAESFELKQFEDMDSPTVTPTLDIGRKFTEMKEQKSRAFIPKQLADPHTASSPDSTRNLPDSKDTRTKTSDLLISSDIKAELVDDRFEAAPPVTEDKLDKKQLANDKADNKTFKKEEVEQQSNCDKNTVSYEETKPKEQFIPSSVSETNKEKDSVATKHVTQETFESKTTHPERQTAEPFDTYQESTIHKTDSGAESSKTVKTIDKEIIEKNDVATNDESRSDSTNENSDVSRQILGSLATSTGRTSTSEYCTATVLIGPARLESIDESQIENWVETEPQRKTVTAEQAELISVESNDTTPSPISPKQPVDSESKVLSDSATTLGIKSAFVEEVPSVDADVRRDEFVLDSLTLTNTDAGNISKNDSDYRGCVTESIKTTEEKDSNIKKVNIVKETVAVDEEKDGSSNLSISSIHGDNEGNKCEIKNQTEKSMGDVLSGMESASLDSLHQEKPHAERVDQNSTTRSGSNSEKICEISDSITASAGKNESIKPCESDPLNENNKPKLEESVTTAPDLTKQIRPEQGQSEQIQSEPNKTKKIHSEPDQTEQSQSEPDQTKPIDSESDQTKQICPEPNQSEQAQFEPDKTKKIHSEPDQTKQIQSEPDQTKDIHPEPDQTKQIQSEPDQTKQIQSKPHQTKDIHYEPDDTKKIHSEPDQTKQVQSEPDHRKNIHSEPDQTINVKNELNSVASDSTAPIKIDLIKSPGPANLVQTASDSVESVEKPTNENESVQKILHRKETVETQEDQKTIVQSTKESKEKLQLKEDNKELLEISDNRKEPTESIQDETETIQVFGILKKKDEIPSEEHIPDKTLNDCRKSVKDNIDPSQSSKPPVETPTPHKPQDEMMKSKTSSEKVVENKSSQGEMSSSIIPDKSDKIQVDKVMEPSKIGDSSKSEVITRGHKNEKNIPFVAASEEINKNQTANTTSRENDAEMKFEADSTASVIAIPTDPRQKEDKSDKPAESKEHHVSFVEDSDNKSLQEDANSTERQKQRNSPGNNNTGSNADIKQNIFEAKSTEEDHTFETESCEFISGTNPNIPLNEKLKQEMQESPQKAGVAGEEDSTKITPSQIPSDIPTEKSCKIESSSDEVVVVRGVSVIMAEESQQVLSEVEKQSHSVEVAVEIKDSSEKPTVQDAVKNSTIEVAAEIKDSSEKPTVQDAVKNPTIEAETQNPSNNPDTKTFDQDIQIESYVETKKIDGAISKDTDENISVKTTKSNADDCKNTDIGDVGNISENLPGYVEPCKQNTVIIKQSETNIRSNDDKKQPDIIITIEDNSNSALGTKCVVHKEKSDNASVEPTHQTVETKQSNVPKDEAIPTPDKQNTETPGNTKATEVKVSTLDDHETNKEVQEGAKKQVHEDVKQSGCTQIEEHKQTNEDPGVKKSSDITTVITEVTNRQSGQNTGSISAQKNSGEFTPESASRAGEQYSHIESTTRDQVATGSDNEASDNKAEDYDSNDFVQETKYHICESSVASSNPDSLTYISSSFTSEPTISDSEAKSLDSVPEVLPTEQSSSSSLSMFSPRSLSDKTELVAETSLDTTKIAIHQKESETTKTDTRSEVVSTAKTDYPLQPSEPEKPVVLAERAVSGLNPQCIEFETKTSADDNSEIPKGKEHKNQPEIGGNKGQRKQSIVETDDTSATNLKVTQIDHNSDSQSQSEKYKNRQHMSQHYYITQGSTTTYCDESAELYTNLEDNKIVLEQAMESSTTDSCKTEQITSSDSIVIDKTQSNIREEKSTSDNKKTTTFADNEQTIISDKVKEGVSQSGHDKTTGLPTTQTEQGGTKHKVDSSTKSTDDSQRDKPDSTSSKSPSPGQLPPEWREPLGLPSPTPTPPPLYQASTVIQRPRASTSPASGRRTPLTQPPVYVDLAYIPHHANALYSGVQFFLRVRARHYVLSSVEPSMEVLDALVKAKQMWNDEKLEVTIIPTYDSDCLSIWQANNRQRLRQLNIDLTPAASRCSINLQDHQTCCAAYRLEF